MGMNAMGNDKRQRLLQQRMVGDARPNCVDRQTGDIPSSRWRERATVVSIVVSSST